MFNSALNNALSAVNKQEISGWGIPDYSTQVQDISLNVEYSFDFNWYATIKFNCLRPGEQLVYLVNGVTQRLGGQVYNNSPAQWNITILFKKGSRVKFTQGSGFVGEAWRL